MKRKQQHSDSLEIRPGKEETPKPQPARAPVATPAEEPTGKPEEQEKEEAVVAPDGEPEPKKEPIPLF